MDKVWLEDALTFLREFLLRQRPVGTFLAEEVVAFAAASGLREPRDRRAWGTVIKAAKRRLMIRSAGFDLAITSNRSPKVLWRAVS